MTIRVEKVEQQEARIDLVSQQKMYFDASNKNSDLSNNIISQIQSSLLTIVLAEIALIGTVELARGEGVSPLAFLAVILLVISLGLFILALYIRLNIVTKVAKKQFQLSRKLHNHIMTKNEQWVRELPSDIEKEDNATSEYDDLEIPNRIFIAVFTLVAVATLMTIILFAQRLVVP